jgi:hypothetical protein
MTMVQRSHPTFVQFDEFAIASGEPMAGKGEPELYRIASAPIQPASTPEPRTFPALVDLIFTRRWRCAVQCLLANPTDEVIGVNEVHAHV